MQQLLELVPIALFFFVYSMKGEHIDIAGWHYEINGIYTATAVLMVATIVQVGITWFLNRKLEKREMLLLAVVLIAGSMTLIFQNKIFIQWKPTLFNGVLALVFIFAPLIGDKKTLLERTLGTQLSLPNQAWKKLNILWICNFVFAGLANLYVAYGYSEETWVSYKLYSSIGFTLVLSLITALLIAPYIKDEPEPKEQTDEN
jgi:intracellular septation protein